MEIRDRKSIVWSAGLAMFAMFFGAGNIVFPLALGQATLDKNIFGILGMVITSVVVPIAGLLAMLLFEGDYKAFFRRIGRVPGFLIVLLILGVIGPFGGIPRCITISYSTLNAFGLEGVKGMNLPVFALLCSALIFCFTYRPTEIVTLIGYVLTPILLFSLAIIVGKGIFGMPHPDPSVHTSWETFSRGLLDGYHTMDLLAAFFFSSVVLLCLREKSFAAREGRFLSIAIMSSLIAAVLLSICYIGFSYLAAGYSHALESVPNHQMLGTLAHELLGPYAGIIAGVAVSFACLTTEIALTAIVAEFLHKTLLKEKISYCTALVITIFLSFLMSLLRFEGITAILGPILQLFYPALIVLSIVNILHKLTDFKPVKLMFYGTILITVLIQIAL